MLDVGGIETVGMTITSTLSRWIGGQAGNHRGLVAIDVGTQAVRAIRVRADGSKPVLEGFRIIRGVGEDVSTSEAIRKALELRLGREPVAVAISSPEVTIRRIEVPPMTSRELREALPWEARRHIAGLGEDAVLDAHVLGPNDGKSQLGVVLVAIPRPLYAEISEATAALGITPEFVDVSALAAMNALLRDHPTADDAPIALLELGSHVGWFSIFTSSDLALFRDLGQRAEQIDRALAAQFGIDPRQLDQLKASGKLPSGEAPDPASAQKALAPVTSELVEDLRSALLYLESRSGGSLERVYLGGSHASLLDRLGVVEIVSQQSGVPLERWNPVERFRNALVDSNGLASASSELAAVSGLVARYFQGA